MTVPLLLPAPREMHLPGGVGAPPDAHVHARIDPSVARPQGYILHIEAGRIDLIGRDAAGVFYGHQTIVQLRRQFVATIPALHIEDWPDFSARGFMLDVSRDKVPTMQALREMVDLLANLKINQLQLYVEHTFAYRGHRTVWADASPLTAEEIRELDAYCASRFIELVPNQNSFGHMERWLRHDRYRHLAEAPDGSQTPWNARWEGPFGLCPTDPGSIELLKSLYAELLPNFRSDKFNVGCDETWDIGQGRSRAEVERRGGTTQVYLDFLKQVHALVLSHGRTMMFWGDIILHQPDLIPHLPRPAIALEWGYEADHPFENDGWLFANAGVPFYVCPGTSSWCSITGRTDNALANLRGAAENGLKCGAIGYLNTDWGDHGHLQYWPVSFAGLAAGAAFSWRLESNRGLDLAAALDLHVFQDKAGVAARAAMDLGNVYKIMPRQLRNSSALFRILVPWPDKEPKMDGLTVESFAAAEQAIDDALATLSGARMSRPDEDLIVRELRNNAEMLRFAARKGRALLGDDSIAANRQRERLREVIVQHRSLWLARNRPGGLSDSAARLERHLA